MKLTHALTFFDTGSERFVPFLSKPNYCKGGEEVNIVTKQVQKRKHFLVKGSSIAIK
jgi:hypothetical protein